MFINLVRNLCIITVLTLVFAYVVLTTVSTCPDGIKSASQQHVECN